MGMFNLCKGQGRPWAKLHTSDFGRFTALLGMVKPIRPAGVVVSAQGSSSDYATKQDCFSVSFYTDEVYTKSVPKQRRAKCPNKLFSQ